MPFKRENLSLSLPCDWSAGDESAEEGKTEAEAAAAEADGVDDEVKIVLPLQRAVEVLQLIALSSEHEKPPDKEGGGTDDDSSTLVKLKWDEFRKLRTVEPDQVDIREYCADVVAETKRGQAEAAFCVVRSALAMILDLEDTASDSANARCVDSTANEQPTKGSGDQEADAISQRKALSAQKLRTKTLKTICKGLMYACTIDPTKEEATAVFKGFVSHVFLLVVSLSDHIKKIDSYGSQISSDGDDVMTESGGKKERQDSDESTDSSGGSYPLGCFLLTGPFVGKADPLVLNESIAEMLGESSESAQSIALDAIRSLIHMSRGSSKASGKTGTSDSLDECDVFFESLISALFQASLSTPWNSRSGLHDGIFVVMDGLGREWSDRFEVEAMHVAILSLKTAPKDIPIASVQAFQFFSRVCDRLYTSPTLSSATVDGFVQDPLTDVSRKDHESEGKKSAPKYASPSEGVVNMLIGELASVKQIVR